LSAMSSAYIRSMASKARSGNLVLLSEIPELGPSNLAERCRDLQAFETFASCRARRLVDQQFAVEAAVEYDVPQHQPEHRKRCWMNGNRGELQRT
jgi:hypothetical protein